MCSIYPNQMPTITFNERVKIKFLEMSVWSALKIFNLCHGICVSKLDYLGDSIIDTSMKSALRYHPQTC